MIKLCRLGEVLSFDALIKKIEGLEKRLSSFPPDEKASVGQLSDPGLDWGLEEKGEGHAEMSADRPQGLDWDNFLDYVSSKNGPMANVLKEWRLLNLTEDTLEIAKGDNSFSSSYLDDPERQNKLASHCQEFFKRDLKIRIADHNNIERVAPSGEEKFKSDGKKYPDVPQPVQDIIQIFQGEIKEEISIKKKGRRNPGKAGDSRR